MQAALGNELREQRVDSGQVIVLHGSAERVQQGVQPSRLLLVRFAIILAQNKYLLCGLGM